ncbi:MAG TPA: hypothetical protein VK722_08925 [Candidatus Aquilonibacter sp.]|jgi:hypothetical protein|nr:hypothetical protein [Candidatus Aquilonibacter sp.]
MPFTVTDCQVTKSSIELTFSDPLFKSPLPALDHSWWKSPNNPAAPGYEKAKALFDHSPLNPSNYTVSDPGSHDFDPPATLASCAANQGWIPPTGMTIKAGTRNAKVSPDSTFTVLTIKFTGGPEFKEGDWVTVIIKNVRAVSEAGDPVDDEDTVVVVTGQVPETNPPAGTKLTKNVEDAVTYPILTESVSYPPSVGYPRKSGGSGFSGGGGGGATQGLGQTASLAIADVLGWKTNSSDPKGFVSALTQSFSITEIEGRIESKWNPKSYTVQTDLAGGITGAQASLYTRAKVAQDNCMPLLDGLYALDPSADPEYVTALRGMAKSQIMEIIKQFGTVPPSILRVNTYFRILLDAKGFNFRQPEIQADPDKVGGTLGHIRDIYGIWFQKSGQDNRFSNSVDDEQNITNFRVISDYMTSLLQSWLSNGQFFELSTNMPQFFGTQLILISRQLNVIAETVNEVRFALDSVFIGPNERQTLLLIFADGSDLPAMYLEDVLCEIESSVTDELPRLLKDGGRISINNNLLPVLQTLINMIQSARNPVNIDSLPDGFSTARVQHSFDDLSDQLEALYTMGQQVGMNVPPGSSLLKTV